MIGGTIGTIIGEGIGYGIYKLRQTQFYQDLKTGVNTFSDLSDF